MPLSSVADPRHLLAAVVNSSDAAIVTTDPELVVISWNPAAERLFGYPADEMTGRCLLALVPPELHAEALAVKERVMAGGRVPAYESSRLHRDGTRVPVSITLWPLRGEDGTPAALAAIYTDLTERKRAEAELRAARAEAERGLARLRAVVSNINDGLVVADPGGTLIDWNPAALRMHGYHSAGEARRHLSDFPRTFALSRPGGGPLPLADWPMTRVLRGETFSGDEFRVVRLDTGREAMFSYSGAPVRSPAGAVELALLTIHDVTDRRRLEDQLRQAQKMDAVGQLAGGVAHDFNNLLTVINGYGELVAGQLPAGHPARGLVDTMRGAGERAAGLTRQLLAFSRKSVVAPRVMELNEVVLGLERMLARLLGEDVDLATRLEPGLWPVHADPALVEQVVLNLCVNARDAMPRGGKLTVETANVRLGPEYAATHAEVTPGRYALLAVADTGTGIPPDVLPHVFEPFFTTKPPGRGTGLGLATVHGIVKQFGGHVGVYTEVGKGTTFKVYLPQAEHAAPAGKSGSVLTPPPRGTETVLLVEDDAAVRALSRFALRAAGYAVIEASCGDEALRTAAGHAGRLHLVVTDVVMPGMGGRELADRLAAVRPGVRVLFTSGYTDDAVVRHGILTEQVDFLQKPFTPAVLARKVREVLDRP